MAPPCSAIMEGTFLLFSTLPSYLPAFAIFSRTACARYLALSRSGMAAGLVAEPRRRDVVEPAWPLPQPSQGERPWADALSGRLPFPLRSGRACQKWPWAS